MKVFFDGQVFNSPAYGGGGRFFYELIWRLTEMPQCEVVLFAGAYRTPLPLGRLVFKCHPFYGLRTPPLGPLRRLVEPKLQSLGRWCLDHSKVDVYHPTYYLSLEPRRKTPLVVTIFDLNHELYPQHYPNSPILGQRKRMLGEATAVVCISETTRRAALKIYPEIAGKVSAIPLASSLQPSTETTPRPTEGKPYFLYVGNRNGYKNFRVMVEACRAVPRFTENFMLICYGGGRFTHEEQQTLAKSGLQACVRQQAGDDRLLADLYGGAICFVYPSLDEGFGIPLLEAMNCRCAVLASRIPVFEEVAGEAAAYFDPGSPEELADRMREMVDDPERRQALVRAGTQRATLFSWERCARQHYELYAEIVSG